MYMYINNNDENKTSRSEKGKRQGQGQGQRHEKVCYAKAYVRRMRLQAETATGSCVVSFLTLPRSNSSVSSKILE